MMSQRLLLVTGHCAVQMLKPVVCVSRDVSGRHPARPDVQSNKTRLMEHDHLVGPARREFFTPGRNVKRVLVCFEVLMTSQTDPSSASVVVSPPTAVLLPAASPGFPPPLEFPPPDDLGSTPILCAIWSRIGQTNTDRLTTSRVFPNVPAASRCTASPSQIAIELAFAFAFAFVFEPAFASAVVFRSCPYQNKEMEKYRYRNQYWYQSGN